MLKHFLTGQIELTFFKKSMVYAIRNTLTNGAG